LRDLARRPQDATTRILLLTENLQSKIEFVGIAGKSWTKFFRNFTKWFAPGLIEVQETLV